jgi:hypothetical protein
MEFLEQHTREFVTDLERKGSKVGWIVITGFHGGIDEDWAQGYDLGS